MLKIIKYLTHELKEIKNYGSFYDFKCTICNVCLFQSSTGTYYLIENNKTDDEFFLLTCDEVIIKNIIE